MSTSPASSSSTSTGSIDFDPVVEQNHICQRIWNSIAGALSSVGQLFTYPCRSYARGHISAKLYRGAQNHPDRAERTRAGLETLKSWGGAQRYLGEDGQRISSMFFDYTACESARKSLGIERFGSAFDQADPKVIVKHPGATVLLLFGASEWFEYKLEHIALFLDRGFNVHVMNHPGYSESEGTPSPESLIAAAELAYKDTRGLIGPDAPVLLYGVSLGTGPITHLASTCTEDDNVAVMLDRPFARLSEAGYKMAENFGDWAARQVQGIFENHFEFDNETWLKDFNGPVAILEAEEEEMMPAGQCERLEACGDNCRRVLMPGGHGWKNESWVKKDRDVSHALFDETLQKLGLATARAGAASTSSSG